MRHHGLSHDVRNFGIKHEDGERQREERSTSLNSRGASCSAHSTHRWTHTSSTARSWHLWHRTASCSCSRCPSTRRPPFPPRSTAWAARRGLAQQRRLRFAHSSSLHSRPTSLGLPCRSSTPKAARVLRMTLLPSAQATPTSSQKTMTSSMTQATPIFIHQYDPRYLRMLLSLSPRCQKAGRPTLAGTTRHRQFLLRLT